MSARRSNKGRTQTGAGATAAKRHVDAQRYWNQRVALREHDAESIHELTERFLHEHRRGVGDDLFGDVIIGGDCCTGPHDDIEWEDIPE